MKPMQNVRPSQSIDLEGFLYICAQSEPNNHQSFYNPLHIGCQSMHYFRAVGTKRENIMQTSIMQSDDAYWNIGFSYAMLSL